MGADRQPPGLLLKFIVLTFASLQNIVTTHTTGFDHGGIELLSDSLHRRLELLVHNL